MVKPGRSDFVEIPDEVGCVRYLRGQRRLSYWEESAHPSWYNCFVIAELTTGGACSAPKLLDAGALP